MLKTNGKKRLAALVCVAAVTTTLFAGCKSKKAVETVAQDDLMTGAPTKISIMTTAYTTDPVKMDSEVVKKIEEHTNTKLEINFVPSASYGDKLNITLASGDIPMIIQAPSKTSSIINAVRAGAFWEVGPYIKNYKYLNSALPNVLNNTSIDGKVYGLYRSRPYGRNGFMYRADWLQNIGMSEIKTVDDFYTALKGFTTKDPDKNGKDDTYGMVVTKYAGPFNIMLTWFGAPNGWGEDKDGKLQPAFMTSEYMDTLKFWKKLYNEKLINQDFAVYDAAKWNDPVINGKAGLIVDVTDRVNSLNDNLVKVNPNAKMTLQGTVTGPKGQKNLPTSGYAGMFMFSKTSIKTEAEFKKVLSFMDKLNDKFSLDIFDFGLEGKQYTVENGVAVKNPDTAIQAQINDINQIATFFPGATDILKGKQTDLQKLSDKIQAANVDICVPNPAEPLISSSYAQKGAQLDTIIEDARVKYIVGQADDAAWNAAIELWKKSGGTDVIKEINDEYAKTKKK